MKSTLVLLTLLASFVPPLRAAELDAPANRPLQKPRTVSDLFDRANEIRFEFGTTKLAESSTPLLEELAAALQREPNVSLEIVCHTSSSGDAKKDLALSRRRADVVKYALASKGVGSDRLVATGRGSEEPIAPNITRTGRMRNERIELHRTGARPSH